MNPDERSLKAQLRRILRMLVQGSCRLDVTMGSAEWDDMDNDAKSTFDCDWIIGAWSAVVDELVVKEDDCGPLRIDARAFANAGSADALS